MTLGSLFDGIGGWQLAAVHAGVEPVWSSEIEKFPCAVTKKHFPGTVQLGDITKLDGAKLWPVDIICAGSPCQDLSIAGKQEGLKGARSGLFRTAIRLVRDMRRASGGKYPRFFVWENVPGAFSSNKGLDFRAVLEEITEAEIPMPKFGRWAPAGVVGWNGNTLAWRVLDAQYWGVPQRRKRIFLVADFGGRCAGEILFERKSLFGDSSEGGKAREGTAAGTESRAGNASGYIPNKARSLTARADGSPCIDRGSQVIAAGFKGGAGGDAGNIGYEIEKSPTLLGGEGGAQKPTVAVYDMTHADEVMRRVPDGRAPTLNARMGTGGNQVPVVSYAIAGNIIGREDKNGGNHLGVNKDIAFTLNTVDRHAVCVGNGQLDNARLSEKVGALNCMHDQQAIMYTANSFAGYQATEKCGSLKASGGDIGGGSESVVCQKNVRRLTPLECERLQGLPDGYTLIDDKSCSDTARYKALGNGMAQPVANWVIKRIVEAVDA